MTSFNRHVIWSEATKLANKAGGRTEYSRTNRRNRQRTKTGSYHELVSDDGRGVTAEVAAFSSERAKSTYFLHIYAHFFAVSDTAKKSNQVPEYQNSSG